MVDPTKPAPRKRNRWTRNQKIAVIIPVVVALIAFVGNEIHRRLESDKVVSTQRPAESSTQQITQPTQPTVSQPTNPSNKRSVQKATAHVKGSRNVVGNNIIGSGNTTGNENQTAPVAVAPNGIAITGGNVQNPTVNNFAPPQRHLTADQQNQLASCLQTAGISSVIVAFTQHSFEAQIYSDDFVSALKAGGWTVKPYGVPYIETRAGAGVQVQITDSKTVPHTADVLVDCLTAAHIRTLGSTTPAVPSGEVILYIGVPEPNPTGQ